MLRAREDRWFDRFRRTGDPAALARVFDRTAPELWRVAAHLCRDQHAAEDAVQSAFLAAIEGRNGWDATRPLLPWLLGLLANRVREGRRQQARTPDSARLWRGAERDPAEVAEHQELGAAFRAALRRIPEPLRGLLERHLVHGLGASELAAELAVPAGTVRMQLHRGLDQLRRKLPQGFVAGGLAVSAMSAQSMAAMRQTVLARLPERAAVASSWVAAGAVGGLAASWWAKAGLLAAVCVVMASGWLWLSGSTAPEDSARTSAAVASVSATPPAPPSSETPAAGVPTERRVVESARPMGSLRVLVQHGGNQQPIAGVAVHVLRSVELATPHPATGSTTATSSQDGTTDAEGVARFELAPGAVRVSVANLQEDPIACEVRVGQVTDCIVAVPVRIAADVQVVDADGHPVADALLVGRRNAYLGGAYGEIGRTGRDGRWRQDCVERTLLLRAVVDGLGASASVLLDARKPTATLRLGGPAGVLFGTVFDRDGQPVAMAWVAIRPQAATKELPLLVRADALGRYRCAYVSPGSSRIHAWREGPSGAQRFAVATAEVAAGQSTQADVRFGRGVSLRASLRRPGGAPWHGVYVTVQPLEHLGFGIEDYRRVATDARGEATLDGLLAGSHEVQVRVENHEHRELVELVEGQDFDFVRELGGSAWVEVRAVDKNGRPLAGWTAKLRLRDGMPREALGQSALDAHGVARFERLPAQPFAVSLHEQPGSRASVLCDAPPNLRTEVVVLDAQLPTAGLRGVVAPAAGIAFSELRAFLDRREIGGLRGFAVDDRREVAVDPTGHFAFAGLPAGTYDLGVVQESGNASGAPSMVGGRHRIVVAAGAELDLGPIEVGKLTLRVQVARQDGIAVRAPRLSLGFGEESPMPRGRVAADGVVEAGGLPPGAYAGLVWGENIGPVQVRIDVRPGAATELPVVAPPAVATTFRFVGLPADVRFGLVTVSQAGAPLARELVPDPTAPYVRGLAPGAYRVEFDVDVRGAATARRGAADFVVGTSQGPVIEVRIGG